tara:strand:- start:682 stop:1485 length:804 start_codon:yes stop_codon:yes gene_type:complete
MKAIPSLYNLKGNIAFVTGANGNLGRVIAKTLAELGSDLILTDNISKNLINFSEKLKKHFHINSWVYKCNLELNKDRNNLIREIKKNHKKLDIIINNAAFVGTSDLSGWSVKFDKQSVDTWNRAIEVNLTAPFHLTQGLFKMLKKTKNGRIINISSIYGNYGPDWKIYKGTKMGNPAAYAASKGGLIQLTRWLSTTLAPDIRVNSISPGGILRNQSKKFLNNYKAKTPLQRMANEKDFIGVVTYLSTDMSKYTTGQNLIVDGGWGVW